MMDTLQPYPDCAQKCAKPLVLFLHVDGLEAATHLLRRVLQRYSPYLSVWFYCPSTILLTSDVLFCTSWILHRFLMLM